MTVLPEKVNLIAFSLGQGKHDTQPYQLVAPSFDAFCEGLQQQISVIEAVMADEDQYQQAKEEISWISAAFEDGRRSKQTALPRAWLGIDIDQCTHNQYITLRRKLRGFDGFLYTTLGDRRNGDDDRRCRVILNLSRPTEPHEIKHYGPLIAAELFPGDVDQKVWDPNRIFYLTGSHAETIRTTGQPVDLSAYPAAPPPVSVERPDVELDICADGVVEWLEEFGALWVPHLNGYKFENPYPVDYTSPSGMDDFLIQLPKDGNYDMIRVEMLHDSDERKGWRLALEKAGCARLVELIDQHNKDAARALQTALSVPAGTTSFEWKKKAEELAEEVTADLSEYELERQSCGILKDTDWLADDEGRLYSRFDTPIQQMPKMYHQLRILGLKMLQAKKKIAEADEVAEQLAESEALAEAEAAEDAELAHVPGALDLPRDLPEGFCTLHACAAGVARAVEIPADSTFLISLGIVSAITGSVFRVEAPYGAGEKLPVGLFVSAEQPSGSGKTAVMNHFQSTWLKAMRAEKARRHATLASALRPEEGQKRPSEAQEKHAGSLPQPLGTLVFSDVTAEALGSSLEDNGGWYFVSDSEQDGIDTLLGLSYTGAKNSKPKLSPLLKGFDAGLLSVKRINRPAVEVTAHGAVAVFAQSGLINKILTASHTSGLAERFLFFSEPDLLGHQTYTARDCASERRAINSFAESMASKLPRVMDFENLETLKFSIEAREFIREQKQLINPERRAGGRYCDDLLRSAVSKMDQQVAKIAASVHVFETVINSRSVFREVPNEIPLATTEYAWRLAVALLEHRRKLMLQSGLIGPSADLDAVRAFLTEQNNGLLRIDISTACRRLRQRAPFKANGQSASMREMRETLTRMAQDGDICGAWTSGRLTHISRTPIR